MPLTIEVVQGSLTDGDERVLVNASNTNAMLGSGVSGAIRRGQKSYCRGGSSLSGGSITGDP